MGARITIFGGGSTHWSPALLVDFANQETLADSEVTLMDVDGVAAKAMAELGAHIAKSRSISLDVKATTDLEESLSGAEFVISAFSVGGFESMRNDIEIPARHGIRQPVGDSVGPGGIARSLRSIPVVLGLARAMERTCPDALLINVTNPLTALCRAATKESQIRVVGLCNEVVGLQLSMSLLFDVPMKKVDPIIGGVNHLPVATSLRIDNEDGFEMLRNAMEGQIDLSGPIWLDPPPEPMHWRQRDPESGWTKADVLENNKVKLELFRRFGALPASSDTHVSEFFPGFLAAASDFGRNWGVHHYGIQGHRYDKAKDNAHVESLLESAEIPRWPSGELVASLLEGLVAGPERALPLNLPNQGQVHNLPEGAVVECMGLAGPRGLSPRDSVEVPSALGEQLRRVVATQELTVEAAISGDRSKVLEAMFCDPVASSIAHEEVVSMTDELLRATAPWLPQFS